MRGRVACTALALAALAAACKEHNPDYIQKPDGNIDVHVDASADVAEVHADVGGDVARDVASDVHSGCTDDNGCKNDPAGPACDVANGVCVPCVKDAHCQADGGSAVCDTTAHTCVACLVGQNRPCAGTKPICDSATKACRSCARDSECTGGPGVCVGDGHCATDQETVYVQKTTASCTGVAGNGSPSMPYCITQNAVQDLTTKSVVVVKGTMPVGALEITTANLTSPSGPILLVGQGGASLASGPSDAAAVHVNGNFDVTVRDLKITGGFSAGVVAETGARLRMNRCVITMNMGGGVLLNSAGFDITNTIIAANSATSTAGCGAWGGLCFKGTVPAGASSRFLNDTVVSNLGPGVACAAPLNITVTGSIVSGNGTLDNVGCTVATCCGAGPQLVSTTDYHLTTGSSCIDRLDPAMSVPDDIDGQSRPQGSMSDCGADEFVPVATDGGGSQ